MWKELFNITSIFIRYSNYIIHAWSSLELEINFLWFYFTFALPLIIICISDPPSHTMKSSMPFEIRKQHLLTNETTLFKIQWSMDVCSYFQDAMYKIYIKNLDYVDKKCLVSVICWPLSRNLSNLFLESRR